MSRPAWTLPEEYAITIVIFQRGDARPVWGSGAGADHPEGLADFLHAAAQSIADDLIPKATDQ